MSGKQPKYKKGEMTLKQMQTLYDATHQYPPFPEGEKLNIPRWVVYDGLLFIPRWPFIKRAKYGTFI